MHKPQAAVAVGTIALGGLIVAGATRIAGDAGYGGVGPNFLPWVVGIALLVCGALLLREVLTGGFREFEGDDDPAPAYWAGFAWVSAGILLNAALITRIGFILSCALCFVFAARGFRAAQGTLDRSWAGWIRDALIGMAIAAPVYWMFGKLLAINLPGLSSTGWI